MGRGRAATRPGPPRRSRASGRRHRPRPRPARPGSARTAPRPTGRRRPAAPPWPAAARPAPPPAGRPAPRATRPGCRPWRAKYRARLARPCSRPIASAHGRFTAGNRKVKGAQTVIGLVLAAGQGQRLRPHTDTLPKTLLTVDGELTILDVILRNLAKAGAAEVAIVAGYAAGAIIARVPAMRARHGLDLTIVTNDRYDRNNAYSLWLARDVYADGALLVNGDTVHPLEVEQTLLAAAETAAGPTGTVPTALTVPTVPTVPTGSTGSTGSTGPAAPAIHLALDVTK